MEFYDEKEIPVTETQDWPQPIHDAVMQVVGVFTIYYLKAHRPFDMEEALVNQTVALMGVANTRFWRLRLEHAVRR
jgi:hypothetical protein